MDWFVFPLAFVVWSAIPIGAAIASSVLDEVRPNRKRFAYVRDAIGVLAVASGAYALAGVVVGIAALLCAIALVRFAPTRAPYTVLSAFGFGLAVASGNQTMIISVAIALLVANILVGALAKERKSSLLPTLAQPIGAIIIAAIRVFF